MICPIFTLLILQPSSICPRLPFPLTSLKVTRYTPRTKFNPGERGHKYH